MAKVISESMGIVPSLEVVPLFAETADNFEAAFTSPFHFRAFSSYGEIARNMLTRQISGGIIPWEIFVADVLALPGQRNCWKVTLFIQACPTELVLGERLYKALYPTKVGSGYKLPPKLTFGVESQNSLTKSQSIEWLKQWKGSSSIKLSYKMLPMDLMMQALEADAIDAVIGPSPWGIHAEAMGVGHRDARFVPGKFAQQLVMVCHKEIHDQHPALSQAMSEKIASARFILTDADAFRQAGDNMSRSGKPLIRSSALEKGARLHAFPTYKNDTVPDISKLVSELMALENAAVLPAHVSANEQTARLLLPS